LFKKQNLRLSGQSFTVFLVDMYDISTSLQMKSRLPGI
jgi:hypothetical protein